jgi:hypothetical protein
MAVLGDVPAVFFAISQRDDLTVTFPASQNLYSMRMRLWDVFPRRLVSISCYCLDSGGRGNITPIHPEGVAHIGVLV